MNIHLPFIIRELPSNQFNQIAILLINSIALYLLIIVARNNGLKGIKSRVFLLMGISMLIWFNFAYLARLFGNYPFISTAFLKVAWFATPIVFYSSYLISIHIMEKVEENRKINKVLFLLTLVACFTAGFTNLIIQGTKFTGGILDIVYGKGFFPFLFSVFVLMVFTLVPLVKARNLIKSAKVFLVGIIAFYLANMIFNIFLPVFFNITRFYFFGDYSTIFLLSLTTYSITRYELFNIKIITTEVVTVVLWTVLFVRIVVSQSFSQTLIDSSVFLTAVIFGLLLIRSVISEVKQREKLQELTGKLKAMDKQKDEFINVAAHELRAPITAIKGYVSMIIEGDAGEITDKARGYLVDAIAVNERLIRLINNMLNVSRIEEGRIVYQMEDMNLARVAKSVYDSFKFEAQRKDLEFKLEIPDDIKDYVHVDVDRINEVVGNFVSNAVKFTEKGSVTIKLSNPDQETVKLEVIDTGPGITKAEQKKLFAKFYRAESTAGKTIGTGLGLYISKLLVEAFHGKIGLDSEFGKGSNFWFELPLIEKSKTESSAE